MRTLSTLSDAEISALRDRSRTACVVYPDHPLPLGTTPSRGRLGVELLQGEALLHVARGAGYAGVDPQVSAWLRTGTKVFGSLGLLIAWVASWCVDGQPPSRAGGGTAAERPRISEAADLLDSASVVVADRGGRIDAEQLRAIVEGTVVGQNGGVLELVDAVARHASKPFPRRPLTVLLLGPTGVGKTHSARAVADALGQVSADDWPCTRMDMSEFSERHSVSRLVGSPPGYIGYGDESLASRLSGQPRQVVIFDEIDKAHPEVLRVLMNLMDAGRLDSTRHGEVTAEAAILLFTSNLGAHRASASDEGGDSDRSGRDHLLRHGVPPELVGRFTRVIRFTALSGRATIDVAAKAIATIAADYGQTVRRIDPAYVSQILSRWSGSGLGVRVLEHLIDTDLGADLSRPQVGTVDVYADAPRIRPSAT